MMKKIFNNKVVAVALATAVIGLPSCSDAFLEEKKDFNNVSTIIYDDYDGANTRVGDLYGWCAPGGEKVANRQAQDMGSDGLMGKSTEEYAGFSNWVNPQVNMNIVNYVGVGHNSIPDYFYVHANNIQNMVWGRVRNVNDVIRGISNGSLPQEQKDELLGQAYFWRAWCYYQMVKYYGAVPIITEVLDPVEGTGTPRSSARECFEFIFDDLDKSAEMLKAATTNGGWTNAAEDWGRVTTATAMALKGRVMNLWASPMFNRQNDAQRWKDAYEYIKASIPTINACGHNLVQAQENTAEAWANMFVRSDVNPEAVMITNFNTIDSESDYSMNNGWEQSIRPVNTHGGGGKEPSNLMIELFPMSDGKLPMQNTYYNNLPKSEIAYDANCPWMNRDPRFYRTFAFPGVRWSYSGTPSNALYPQSGGAYELWSYVWYLESNKDKVDDARSGGSWSPDGLEGNNKSFYVRKRSCDNDVSAANYMYSTSFAASATPWIEIRYAEVLLNLAEAAAMAGQTTEAIDLIRQIRQRVGYTGDCGISSTMDQATTVAAVLYERQIEFAYEDKRFDDMRRWMLYDGGATQPEGAPSTWNVSGWSGNTCNWLGVSQFNGMRRDLIEIQTKRDIGKGAGIGEDANSGDPMMQAVTDSETGITEEAPARPAGIDYRNELAPQLEALKTFYDSYFKAKVHSGDAYDGETGLDYTILFRPHYYFLGMNAGAMNNNKDLPQTIGWDDNRTNTLGTFDPLAETNE